MAPRYDIPKLAPEPLRRVQLFVNTADLGHGSDWLREWLEEQRLEGEHDRALELREALGALVVANNDGRKPAPDALEVVNRGFARLVLGLDGEQRLRVRPGGDALEGVLAVTANAMLDGSWQRLKACRTCRWCFYDYSPNRSARWCSMRICGNRRKTRAYRRRRGSP